MVDKIDDLTNRCLTKFTNHKIDDKSDESQNQRFTNGQITSWTKSLEIPTSVFLGQFNYVSS